MPFQVFHPQVAFPIQLLSIVGNYHIDDSEQGFVSCEHALNCFERVARIGCNGFLLRRSITYIPQQQPRHPTLFSSGSTIALSNLGTAESSRGFKAANWLVHHFLEEQARLQPDTIAVRFGNQSLTFRHLNLRANRLAGLLNSLGAGEGVFVAVCAERSIEQMVAVAAILKAGAAYVPLDPAYPSARLSFMLEDCGAPLLLTQSALAGLLPAHGAETVRLDEIDLSAPSTDEDPVGFVSTESPAYIIYTSGSTGKPKGVVMPHRPLINLLQWQNHTLPTAARTLQFAPLSFDVSFQEIFSTWHAGGTLFLIDEALRRDPLHLWEFILREKIERLFLPFVALQQLAEFVTQACHLRDIITAGEQLRITPPIRRMFGNLKDCGLHNHYGPSETHVVTAHTLRGRPDEWPALPSIGQPIFNTMVHLIDENGREAEMGELCIGGECLCRGYLNQPQLTAQKFVTLDSGELVYKTGDLALRSPEGDLEFLGRIDGQAKVRGFRVEPGEIEIVLSEYPAMRDIVVVANSDANGDNRLIAYAIGGPDFSVEALRDFARKNLPDYLVPSLFVPLAAFPLTPSGKVDRRSLPTPEELTAADHPDWRQGDLESTIAEMWREALGHSSFGANDNFFDVGGDSLRMTRVQVKLRERYGCNLEITTLFEHPTIRRIAAHLNTNSKNNFSGQISERAAKQKQALAAKRKVAK
jgi:amino acid adenylation domain-containing protein